MLCGSRHAGLMVLLVCTCGVFTTPMVSAHNFIMSPSRALSASVTRPCIARVSPFPHIQVISGQSFPMEWSVGHGDSGTKNFYWVLVHEKDYEQLNNFEDSVADDYIKMAPTSAYIYPVSGVGSKWAKRHIGNPADNIKYPMNTANNYFDRVATSTEVDFITRDAIYREKSIFLTTDPTKINQWVFRADKTAGDVRVAYKSAKYPWIRAVHKFVNVFAEHQPYADQANIANFEVPTNSEPGNYIYHFKWGGYRDCVDLDVRVPTSGPVALPFGKNKADALAQSGSAPFVKIDHCEFSFVLNPLTQCRVLPKKADGTVDASQCVQECNGINYGQYYACTGVQIVRATNPSMVTLPYTPNIPFYRFNDARTGFNGPCDYNSIHQREKAGCRTEAPLKFYDTQKTNPEAGYSCSASYLKPQLKNNDDYICYGAMPLHDENLQTVEDYVIVDDPADPKYYSTCIIRIEPGGFLPVTSPTPKPVQDWLVGDQCMSCSFRDSLSKVGLFSSPIWTNSFTNTCRNCDEPTE